MPESQDVILDLSELPRKLPERYIKKLKKDIAFIVNQNIPGLKEICLFGSCARGDFKWSSDLDLAIVTEEPFTDHSIRGFISDVLDLDEDDIVNGVSTDVIFRNEKTDGGNVIFNRAYQRDYRVIWKREG